MDLDLDFDLDLVLDPCAHLDEGRESKTKDQVQVQVQDEVARSTPAKLDSSVKSFAPRGF